MSVHSSRGKGWEKTRLRILNRDGYICRQCGNYGDTVDHIIPKAKGGTDDDWNLATLCRKHNSEKGDRELPRINYWNTRWIDHL